MRILLLLLLSFTAAAETLTCDVQDNASSLTVTCPRGSPSQVPACNPSASPSTFASSPTTVQLSANCSATSYEWSNAPNSPGVLSSGATASATFGPGTPPGAYTFYVRGTNSAGTGPQGSVVVTVTAASSGGGCASGPTGTFQGSGQWKDFTLSPGGVASFRLPALTQPGRNAEIIAVQTDITPGDLLSEIAISETCGSFDVPDPLCKMTGSSWSMNLHAFATPNSGYCTLTPGRTYYANVRNRVNGVESCPQGSCSQRLSYVGNLQ